MGVELGSGSFGDVFECVLKENGEKVRDNDTLL